MGIASFDNFRKVLASLMFHSNAAHLNIPETREIWEKGYLRPWKRILRLEYFFALCVKRYRN
jgi:hypothetical protein